MNDLERALREAEIPDAVAARERARRTVLAAHRPVRRRPRLALVWVAVACGLAAVVFSARDTGPARALEQRVRNVFTAPTPAADPGGRPPLPGRLLVLDRGALFVVSAAASARQIGAGTRRDVVAARAVRRRGARADARRDRTRRRPCAGRCAARRRCSSRAGRRAACTSRTAPAGTCGSSTATGSTTCSRGASMAAVAAGVATERAAARVAWAATDGTVTVEDADTAKVAVEHRSGPGPSARVVGRRPRGCWSPACATVRSTTLAAASRRRRGVPAGGSSPWRSSRATRARRVLRGRQTTVTVDGRTVLSASRAGCATSSGHPTGDGCSRAGRAPTTGSSCAATRSRPSGTASAPDARTRGWTVPGDGVDGSRGRRG